ncbi:MAG: NUDIX domain-containing protein [Alphaproteobacteria bacterium]|nr:NUDIX domain-containing protein [Alphaproteobacteria bacterium]MDP6831000.1 NUDIX domain-containing protein [Alphaproteobacteria bacterium]
MSQQKKPDISASTVLLIRDGVDGLEVFMVVRHHEIDSFSGALVFPGGKVDPEDADAREFCRGAEGMDEMTLSHCVAAVREAFEECGVLLATNKDSDELIKAEQLAGIEARWRTDLAAGKITMADVCRTEGLILALDKMVSYAHWITPRVVPKVFDTQFFVARAPVDQAALHDGSESTDSEWLRPEAAVADAEMGKRTVVFPTRMNLLKLAQYRTVDEAMAAARATTTVTVQPEPAEHPKGRTLRIPAEAGYPGSHFLVEDGGTKVTMLE